MNFLGRFVNLVNTTTIFLYAYLTAYNVIAPLIAPGEAKFNTCLIALNLQLDSRILPRDSC